MDAIGNMVSQSVKSLKSTPPSTPEQKSEPTVYRVDGGAYTKEELLWKRFSGLYGYTFARQYGAEPTAEWMLVLDQISAKQIGKGIDACFKHYKTFPPNPMEFHALCLPEGADYGLPSDAVAFNQATGNATEKHPAVVFTLQNMAGAVFEMRRLNTNAARDMFIAEWLKTIAHVAEGGALPEPVAEIESATERKVTNEKALDLFAAMRAGLGPGVAQSSHKETTCIGGDLKNCPTNERSFS